jgi:hypothetical protein
MVRGRHGNIYSVDLPFWLPDDVKRTIVAQFREYLIDEFVIMMKQESQRMKESFTHSRNPSGESTVSGFSDESAQQNPSPDVPTSELGPDLE